MDNSKQEICFFDSGIGGLNVLAAAVKKISGAHFVYVADNYSVPYGNLGANKIKEHAVAAFELIAKRKPAAAVVACNTVTSCCIEYLRSCYSFPIIGIQPAVKPACAGGKECAVLATEATANSAALQELIKKYGGGRATVYACPQLAAYIENNIFKLRKSEIEKLLPDITQKRVVLGCTHYIFIREIIKEHYGCEVFDGVEGTVNRLIDCLGLRYGTLDDIACNMPASAGIVEFLGGDSLKNRIIYEHMF